VAATGRIVQFNIARGYGFIAPDDGGDDVFLHVADLKGAGESVRPGMRVKYEVMEGQRGSKAFDAALLDPPRLGAGSLAHDDQLPPRLDDDLSEVITTAEYTQEITEILIAVAPAVTAAQIVEVRDRLAQRAQRRGWLED